MGDMYSGDYDGDENGSARVPRKSTVGHAEDAYENNALDSCLRAGFSRNDS